MHYNCVETHVRVCYRPRSSFSIILYTLVEFRPQLYICYRACGGIYHHALFGRKLRPWARDIRLINYALLIILLLAATVTALENLLHACMNSGWLWQSITKIILSTHWSAIWC